MEGRSLPVMIVEMNDKTSRAFGFSDIRTEISSE